jgi:hypothetical protein
MAFAIVQLRNRSDVQTIANRNLTSTTYPQAPHFRRLAVERAVKRSQRVHMYDLYKPLRNELRQNALLPSLRVVWAWMQHLQFGLDLPLGMEVPQQIRWLSSGPARGIYEWELALLAKELLVLAPEDAGDDLRSWKRFSAAVNKLKNLDNEISRRYEKLFREHIFIEMYRTAHHQFLWQRTLRMDSEVSRYFKIFGVPALDAILRERLGLSAHALYSVGLASSGYFLNQSDLATPPTFNLTGVTAAQVTSFFDRYSKSTSDMRLLCEEVESFDENFVYTFNPLLQFPLVSFVSAGRSKLIAPVPRYLIRRFTEGVYYDILGAQGFEAAFGDSYQTYVGEVLEAVNSRNSLAVLGESDYVVGKDRKRSVDWIASDDTGELFIECKTKRLRLDAKIALSDLAPLEAELSKLAEFTVQIYKTLADAISGRYSHWGVSSRPIYPIIVTLEEWYVFGHQLDSKIDACVRSEFGSAKLDEQLLEKYPVTICSVGDFERLMALVAVRGIGIVMDERLNPKRRLWLLHAALLDAFPEDYPKTRANLFPAALKDIAG